MGRLACSSPAARPPLACGSAFVAVRCSCAGATRGHNYAISRAAARIFFGVPLPSAPELRAAFGDSRAGLAVRPAGIARTHVFAPCGVVTFCGVVASCAPVRYSLLRPRVSYCGCCCAWYASSPPCRPRARSASLRVGSALAPRVPRFALAVRLAHTRRTRGSSALLPRSFGIAIRTFALRARASCALCALRLFLACARGTLLALMAPPAALDS